MSAAYQLLLDRMEGSLTIKRLLEALSPEAAAPLEHLTPLAVAWRKYAEAEIAAHGEIIEQGGDKHSVETETAINDREELSGIFIAMPSGSPAGAMVRLIWVAMHVALETLDREHHVRPDGITSVWDAVLLEATLDLLAPGVLEGIAAGLARRAAP